jgi:3-dehydroquinate dehydratase-2
MQECLFLGSFQNMMELLIINGPNLNLLGKREPHLYGTQDFDQYLADLRSKYPQLQLSYFQSNEEGALISKIQEAGFSVQGILLNAAGYTHTSVALADAVAAIPAPVVEVHITHPYAREAFRRHSYVAPYCKASVTGFGLHSYELALQGLLHWLATNAKQQ